VPKTPTEKEARAPVAPQPLRRPIDEWTTPSIIIPALKQPDAWLSFGNVSLRPLGLTAGRATCMLTVTSMSNEQIRGRVRSCIDALGVLLPADFDDDTELITSGLLNSLALFDLAGWIEDQCGGAVKAEEVDIPREWNSVALIAGFITQSRQP